LIKDVIDRASNVAQGAKIVDWIGLQNDLRSDTSWVIFSSKNGHWTREPFNETTYDVMNGHSGAIYLLEGTSLRPRTIGQPKFHDALRAAFANNESSIANALNALEKVIEYWIWKGEDQPARPHPMMRDGRNRILALPGVLDALAGEQHGNFTEMWANVQQMRRKYGGGV
jgi:hypothetical protein